MRNGVYTARITDNGVHEVFIDQDILETEHLNKLTRQNRMAAEAEVHRREAKKAQEAYQNILMLQKVVFFGSLILSFLLGYQLG